MDYQLCPQCKGRGNLKIAGVRQECPQCKGSGVIEARDAATPAATRNTTPLHARPSRMMLWYLLGGLLLACFLSIGSLLVILLAHDRGNTIAVNIGNGNSNGSTIINNLPLTPTHGFFPPTTVTVLPNQTVTPNQTMPPRPTATQVGKNPTATPTAVLVPLLRVSPQSIHLTLCVAGSSSVTAVNQGGGVLHWTAQANNLLYQISPNQGQLSATKDQVIAITGITLNGIVTISSNGGGATITITCG